MGIGMGLHKMGIICIVRFVLQCEGSCNGSRMLVFGGFTSRLVTSRELWLYDGGSEQWTQLESAVS